VILCYWNISNLHFIRDFAWKRQLEGSWISWKCFFCFSRCIFLTNDEIAFSPGLKDNFWVKWMHRNRIDSWLEKQLKKIENFEVGGIFLRCTIIIEMTSWLLLLKWSCLQPTEKWVRVIFYKTTAHFQSEFKMNWTFKLSF
jgi:hypothetical protein